MNKNFIKVTRKMKFDHNELLLKKIERYIISFVIIK